jgi:hypothetical protein
MLSVGLLSSLTSGENKLDFERCGQYTSLQRMKHIIKDGDYGKVYVTGKTDDYMSEVNEQVKQLCKDKPDVIALYCGDGSIMSFLTALKKYWPEETIPPIAHPKGGSFGIIAKRLRIQNHFHYLKSIVESDSVDSLAIEKIKMMWVQGDSVYRHLSFATGTGFPVVLLEEIYKRKRLKNIRILAMFTGAVLSAIFEGEYYKIYNQKQRYVITALMPDGTMFEQEKDWLATLAHSVESLSFPTWFPFPVKTFQKAERSVDTFQTICSSVSIKRALCNVPPVYAGKDNRDIMELNDEVKTLRIRSEQPFKFQSCGELSIDHKPCQTKELVIGPTEQIPFVEKNVRK